MIPLPNISGNRYKLSQSGYIKAIGAGVLIIAVIVTYVLQFDHFDKILNATYFLILSACLGAALGVFLALRFSKKEKEAYDKMRVYMICIMLSIVFMPLLVGLINRYLDFRTVQVKEAQLLQLKPSTNQPFGYLRDEEMKITHYDTVILLDGDIHNLKTKNNPFPNQKAGDKIMVPIHQGLLGINFLDFY